MLTINPEDILFAESLLLSDGLHFDEIERIPFIKRFDVIDVQAVPGSGKTTALLAKLILLERNLPFSDNSGVLVLSHTNSGIQKIEKEIKKHCPRLFSYPNYIGTIQGFIDKYLAIPYYRTCYKKSPALIDSNLYNQKIEKWFFILLNKLKSQNKALYNKLWYIKNNYNPFLSMRFGFFEGKICLLWSLNGNLLSFYKPRPKSKKYEDYCEEEKSDLYKWALKLKTIVLKNEGILHYDDAYFLANRIIDKYPEIISELNCRFKYVFVDEMQDMKKHQIDILERIFFKEDSLSCFERIGDVNQSIYGEEDFYENATWGFGNRNVINLTGTHSLSKVTSAIVERFGIIHTPINGSNEPHDEFPKLILYKQENIEKVLPLFAKIIQDHKAKYPELYNGKYPIKAIGWRKESDKGIALSSYFKEYQDLDSFHKINGPCLWGDLQDAIKDTNKNSLAFRFIDKAIWKACTFVLKFENFSNYELASSVDKLQNYLNINFNDFYNRMQELVYNSCIEAIENDIDKVYVEIKNFISQEFLKLLGVTYRYSKTYLENKIDLNKEVEKQSLNIYSDAETGIQFEVTTVHSVKGETHLATLYLETYFQNDGGKSEHSYESQRLIEQLKGVQINSNEQKKRKKQSAKMVYVGFSRPKYLLCFAAQKENFDEESISQIEKMGWEIKYDLI